ncbi:GGDEF domain-containing protein [Pseudokineococcus basanitobsidens]|uniref:GGDEF domain-containing protein n=1 Tax=Pseudokineococcus basanitobsidens TaxID=1926649 RepID=A0ABU8RKM6_9ACTN
MDGDAAAAQGDVRWPPGATGATAGRLVRRWWARSTARVGVPVAAGQGLLLATALIVVVTIPLQRPDLAGGRAVVGAAAVLFVAALLTPALPWARWPQGTVLVFPALTVTTLAALSHWGGGLGAAYVGVYVLAFGYLGLYAPARTAWWLLPLAVYCYGPTAGGWTNQIVARLVVVVLVWMLVAGVLAAMRRAQHEAHQALEAAACTDALTQLDNRRALEQHLDVVPAGTVVVVCDLDHFKSVNDTHGHAAGDQVLADFAGLLRAQLRSADRAVRYGGEEFLLLLQAQPRAVPDVLARLHQHWARRQPGITFSAGWAVHRPGREVTATITAADQALYRAKTTGRDRDVPEAPPIPLQRGPRTSTGPTPVRPPTQR